MNVLGGRKRHIGHSHLKSILACAQLWQKTCLHGSSVGLTMTSIQTAHSGVISRSMSCIAFICASCAAMRLTSSSSYCSMRCSLVRAVVSESPAYLLLSSIAKSKSLSNDASSKGPSSSAGITMVVILLLFIICFDNSIGKSS